MPKTLKGFVEILDKEYPEEIIRVSRGPFYPHQGDCAALLYHLEKQGKWPMVIFDHVVTLSGRRWPGSIQFQADGTFSKLAVSLGLSKEQISATTMFDKILNAMKKPLKPMIVDNSNAPVMKTVWQKDEANLFNLPCFLKDRYDARPGWLCGVTIGKDFETNRYNLSWHRILSVGPKRGPSRLQYRHLWAYLKKYKAAGYKQMPVAWVFGHHPAFMLSAAIRVGWDYDEYDLAGGILNEPLRLTPSATWGKDFLIPADAECVVEGYLDCDDFDVNGPWGDFMRYYSPQTLEPVFIPTAIDISDGVIFDDHLARHDLYSQVGISLTLLSVLREKYSGVKMAYFVAPFVAIIQFKADHPGEVQRMAHLALTASGDHIKQVIIVDEDINPFDLHEVLFSLGTRVDANTNQVQIIRDLDANRHDPSAIEYMRVGGFIIDSTKPSDKPFPEMGFPSEEILEKIKLYDYMDKNRVENLKNGLAIDMYPKII